MQTDKILAIHDCIIESESCLLLYINAQTILERILLLTKYIEFKQILIITPNIDKIKEILGNNASNIKITNHDLTGDIELNASHVYDNDKLIKLIKNNDNDLAKAVLWKIRNKEDIKNAIASIERLDYPIARHINRIIGRNIAEYLSKTSITPNQVTAVSLISGLIGVLAFLKGGYPLIILGALFVQIHCILDFCDGHLARLNKMSSPFGMFWDGIVNKIVEGLLYPAIAIGIFNQQSDPKILIVGLLTLLGHFMIEYITFLKLRFFSNNSVQIENIQGKTGNKGLVKRLYSFLENWDVRMYIITFFAAINQMELALLYFAMDFNFRWVYNVFKITYRLNK